MATVSWRNPYVRSNPNYTASNYYAARDAARKRRYARGWRLINGKWTKVPQPTLSSTAIVAKKELKGVDTTLVGGLPLSNMSDNEGIVVLNLIQQGTGSWNRIGRNALLKSVRCSGEIQAQWTSGGPILQAPWFRLVLVWDTQPSGIIPNKNDIFGNTNQSGIETSTIYNHIRYDNMSRFSIIHDEMHTMDLSALVTVNDFTVQRNCKFDFFVPLKDRKVTYSGQSSPLQISDISSGALYFIVLNDAEATAGFGMGINGTARLRYTD